MRNHNDQVLFIVSFFFWFDLTRSSFNHNCSFNRCNYIFFSNVFNILKNAQSSPIYNTSATQVRHEWHKYDTSATQVRHDCYTNDTRATRLQNFDFDNGTSKNILLHLYIYYMASERLQGDYLLEMTRSHAKMRLKSAPQKLNFFMAKAVSKSYTLDCSSKCSCTWPHSYA